MAETILFKCPACGGNLEYDPEKGQFACPFCGSTYTEAELREQSAQREEEARRKGQVSPMREYHCANCGAEIVVGETTAATRCYYCHSPVVLADRVSDEYYPEGLIPFRFNREEARAKFDAYIGKKWFVDRRFFSQAQMEDFSGVYYPYWLGNIEGNGSYNGEGTTVSTVTTGSYIVTTTRHYSLHRAGKLTFRNIVRKGLKAADRKLSDGIHPYDLGEMQPFASGYLSGFLAEKWDVEKEKAEASMEEEVRSYVTGMLTQNTGLSSLKGQSSFQPTSVRTKYTLLPTWVLTYSDNVKEQVYYYMMNGQNGKICGKLPLRKGKLALVSALAGLVVFGLLTGGGYFLW